VKLTWLGTACIKLECGGVEPFWIDPFISMTKDAVNPTTAETFAGISKILITHGHFDHFHSIPELNSKYDIHVYCTQTPGERALRRGIPENKITLFEPGDAFELGGVSIRAYQSVHSKPDPKMQRQAVRRLLSSLTRAVNFLKLSAAHLKNSEANETMLFEMMAEGRRIVMVGSPRLPEDEELPEPGADLLILPFSGVSDPTAQSYGIIEALRPKAVLLNHFANDFPPMTDNIDKEIAAFIEGMREKYPDVPVTWPKFGEEMELSEILGIAEDAGDGQSVRIA